MSEDQERLRLLEAGRKLLEQRKLNKPPPGSGESEAVRLRYKLQAQGARVDTLLQEKRSLEERVTELEAQLASGRNQFEAAEERERAHARATAELREQLEEERERVRQQGESMAQMVSKLQVQLVEEQTANERLRRERERWRKLDDTATALEAEKTELQREKGELLGDALELKERVKELEQKNAQLTQDMEQLRATRNEGESATADRTRALEEQLREHKREHEAEINALNVLLREQIDSCKRISVEKRSLEAQREHDLEQIEQLMEERRELMGRADKKSEKLTTGMEELERELQATRAQLKDREREAAAEASEAWKHEKTELIRELDLVKTKFARTQRVERTKFLEFYRIIQELRDENEKIKAQGGGGGSGGGASEAQRRLADENEKQAKRIREQRDFIEELMQSKSKLMDQVSSEVKRNASLARENAVLQDTIRQQLSLIENHSTHSDHQHAAHSPQTPTRPDPPSETPRSAAATPSHAPTATAPSTPLPSTAAAASSTKETPSAPQTGYTQRPSPIPQQPRPQVASQQQPRAQAHSSPSSVQRDLFSAPPKPGAEFML